MYNSEIFQALILGVVQGASEVLPISSSGHLILIPNILGWDGLVNSLAFDVALHLGTTLAVVAFFWKDWTTLLTSFAKTLPKGFKAVWQEPNSRLLIFLAVGSVPAALVGLILEKEIEESFRSNLLIAFDLIIFALVLYVVDRVSKKRRGETKINLFDSLFIGSAQALALLPWVSRSGITISAGLSRDLNREAATRFSFLLSTPAILGAALLKLTDMSDNFADNKGVFTVGLLAAAISGWLAIKILLSYVKSNNFNIFVIYRIVLGVSILLFLL